MLQSIVRIHELRKYQVHMMYLVHICTNSLKVFGAHVLTFH
jgi:hypothetical protein